MEVSSAIIGFVAIGAQLGATAIKLKKLWDQIKDIPDGLRDLLDSLEQVSSLLSDAELLSSLQEENLTKSIQRCRRTYEDLDDMSKELEKSLTNTKGRLKQRFVALRAVMKQDIFEKHEKRLEGALDTFSSILQLSNR